MPTLRLSVALNERADLLRECRRRGFPDDALLVIARLSWDLAFARVALSRRRRASGLLERKAS